MSLIRAGIYDRRKWGSGVSLLGSNPEPPMSALDRLKADIEARTRHVRFTPESGHRSSVSPRRARAR